MLAVDVEFLHGTLRAGSHAGTVVTGQSPDPEWPPSPARVFAAFVAADGTRDRCRVTSGEELRVLEGAPPPRILASGGDEVAWSPLRDRYVVANARASSKTVQEYPLRKATTVRPGSMLSPRTPRVRYLWDVMVGDEDLAALQRRAARIPYLGASDHPARVRVERLTAVADAPCDLKEWRPNNEGTVYLPVVTEGHLDRLDHAHAEFAAGRPTRAAWYSARLAAYTNPAETPRARRAGSIAWLRLERPVRGDRVLDLTQTLRSAILALVGDEARPELHGHVDREDVPRASFLAFPTIGHEHADGRIRGVGVWMPSGTDGIVRRQVAAAVTSLETLRCDGLQVRVTPHDGRSGPRTTTTARWRRPATEWVTATPVVFERHGEPTVDDVRRWFRHAGLPEPVAAVLDPEPFTHGGVRLRPSHLRHRYRTRFAHLLVRFDELQAGPMIVGRGRHFGLGLLHPVLGGGGP